MRLWRAASATAAVGLVLAGCSTTSGNVTPFASSAPQPPPGPPPVVYGAFLEGPAGSRLTPSSRDKALAAEQDALSSGQRKTWKGDNGTFGYVEPGPGPAPKPAADPNAPPPPPVSNSADSCRSFTSTVFIAGRPQVGHGRGCQNPDGSYHIVS